MSVARFCRVKTCEASRYHYNRCIPVRHRCIGAKVLLNPLRRSEDGIQRWLLRQTPLGSSREQVLVVAARRGWQVHQEYRGRFINKSVSAGGLEQSSAAM